MHERTPRPLGGFWDRAQTSVVTLTDAASQLDKTNYVLTNPVKDHLVGTVAAWPGANSLNDTRKDSQDRRSITVKRPDKFFRSDERAPSRLPDSVTLTLISPPEWEADEFRKAIAEQIAKTEEDIQSARVRDKKRVMGRVAVNKQRWHQSPKTYAKRGELSPRVAGQDKWRRIEAIMRNKAFLQAYRAAYDLYRRGEKAVFPVGTWKLAQESAAVVESG